MSSPAAILLTRELALGGFAARNGPAILDCEAFYDLLGKMRQ
jgi:hypothetical protein